MPHQVATICNGFGKDGNPPTQDDLKEMVKRFRSFRGERSHFAHPVTNSCWVPDDAKGSPLEAKRSASSTNLSAEPNSPSPSSAAASANGDDEDVDMSDLLSLAQSSGEASGAGLLDPCLFNSKTLRHSCIPAANGHFSARALAKFFAALANGGEYEGHRIVSGARVDMMRQVQATESNPLAMSALSLALKIRLQFLIAWFGQLRIAGVWVFECLACAVSATTNSSL